MSERLLTDDLSATFTALERILARHQQAESYDLGHNRLVFVHSQLELLYSELRALRLLVTVLQTFGEAESEIRLWQQSLATLRDRQPAALRTPGQAIIQGDVELLKMVEYLSAAAELVRERRLQIGRKLEQRLHEYLCEQTEVSAHDWQESRYSYEQLLATLRKECGADELLELLSTG